MSDAAAQRRPWRIAPYLWVEDVVATANYYRDRLGFQYERFWGEPPSFCMVYRSGVVIMLAQLETKGGMRPNRLVDPEGGAYATHGHDHHGHDHGHHHHDHHHHDHGHAHGHDHHHGHDHRHYGDHGHKD